MRRNWDGKRKQLSNIIVRYFRRRPCGAKQTTTTTATRTSPNKTIAVHVRYKSLYISLPSSSKQERGMTKFYVIWGTRTMAAIFFVFPFEIKRGHCIFSMSYTRCCPRCCRGFFFTVLQLKVNLNSKEWTIIFWRSVGNCAKKRMREQPNRGKNIRRTIQWKIFTDKRSKNYFCLPIAVRSGSCY